MTTPVEKSDKKRLGPAATIYRAVALSFVIPSEAEGPAVYADLSWECFLTERSVVENG